MELITNLKIFIREFVHEEKNDIGVLDIIMKDSVGLNSSITFGLYANCISPQYCIYDI